MKIQAETVAEIVREAVFDLHAALSRRVTVLGETVHRDLVELCAADSRSHGRSSTALSFTNVLMPLHKLLGRLPDTERASQITPASGLQIPWEYVHDDRHVAGNDARSLIVLIGALGSWAIIVM